MSDESATLDELLQALTERQRRFCELWAGECDGNGTKAAREAGYEGDDATLAVTAWRLLRNDKVRAVLTAFQENDPKIATRVERHRFLTRVMRGEETEFKPTRDEDGHLVHEPCPPSIKDRLAAQEALSKLGGECLPKKSEAESDGFDIAGVTIGDIITLANASKGK